MKLVASWQALPETERTQRLRAMRAAAWLSLRPSEAAAISIATRCCEAGCPEAWQAADEILNQLPTLTLRRLLVDYGARQSSLAIRRSIPVAMIGIHWWSG